MPEQCCRIRRILSLTIIRGGSWLSRIGEHCSRPIRHLRQSPVPNVSRERRLVFIVAEGLFRQASRKTRFTGLFIVEFTKSAKGTNSDSRDNSCSKVASTGIR